MGNITVSLLGAAALLVAASAPAQQCQGVAPESAGQRERWEAAVRFVQEVNVAQARVHTEVGEYVSLAEATNLATVPAGFVPRLTIDQLSYAISLKDLFDPCGFALFSDHEGTIYEARPVARNK